MGTAKYAEKEDPAVAVLLDEAHRAQEEYRDILDRRSGLRETLRTLVASGRATKEQAEMVEEIYPLRVLNRKNTNAAKAAEG